MSENQLVANFQFPNSPSNIGRTQTSGKIGSSTTVLTNPAAFEEAPVSIPKPQLGSAGGMHAPLKYYSFLK